MPIAIACGSLVNTRSICPGIRLKTSVPINIIPIPPTSEVDSVFLQRSIRSEIIAVCGFHKIIPCENSYFHRGFYARKSYKSMCFYVDLSRQISYYWHRAELLSWSLPYNFLLTTSLFQTL